MSLLCSSLASQITFNLIVFITFSSVQLFSHVWLSMTPWTAANQVSLSITSCQSLLKLVSIELVVTSNHLILCCPFLLPPSMFPSIRVFSNNSVLCIRWPKYWSFIFSISPSNEYSGLISFEIDWFDLLSVQGTLKILPQHHSSKAQEQFKPAISCLGVDPKNTKILKDTCTPTNTATLDTIAKTQKQPTCRRTDEWIKKMGYVYTVQYYSAIKKDVMMPSAAAESKVEIIMLNEVRKTRKD